MQLHRAILEFADGLRVLGISPTERIALFADNSCRWLVADQGKYNKSTSTFVCYRCGIDCNIEERKLHLHIFERIEWGMRLRLHLKMSVMRNSNKPK